MEALEKVDMAAAGERVRQIVALATRMTDQLGQLLRNEDVMVADALMAAALAVRGLGEVALAAEDGREGAMRADDLHALLRRVFDYALLTPVTAFKTQEEMDAFVQQQKGGMH